jgi:aspartate oxidase
MCHGNTMNATVGYVMPWNGTVVMMSGSAASSNSQVFTLYKNGTSFATLSFGGSSQVYSTTINADFAAGDEIAFYISGYNSGCTNTICWMAVKRRI